MAETDNSKVSSTQAGDDKSNLEQKPPETTKPASTPFAKNLDKASQEQLTDEQKKVAQEKADAEKKAKEEAEKNKQPTPTLEETEKERARWQGEHDKLKSASEKRIAELEAQVKDYNTDPIVALKKYHPQILENLEAASNPDGFIAKWQHSELMKQMKEKFPEEVTDDWKPDGSEAFTAGTPSYYWRIATEEKRSGIINSLRSRKAQEQAVVDEYAKQRDIDLKFLADTYGFDETAMKARLASFDAIHQQVIEKKASTEKHPFALRNLFRGFFFDELVAIHNKQAVDKAISELKDQYKAKGIVLPELQVTDLTKAKEQQNVPEQKPTKPLTPFQKKMASYTQ